VKPIYTLDFETDPFKYGRDPQPFCAGLYTGEKFYSTWGDLCVEEMHKIVLSLPPGIIYAHNGGKFDFYFCMDWIANQRRLMIINGRIVQAQLWRRDEQTSEFRDSYAILPFALKKYKKFEVDFRVFERAERESHKRTIIHRVKTDCIYLHELCTEFYARFGDNITIGSTSMKQLKKLHKFDCLDAGQDDRIRKPYYFGGRVQCFEKGIIKPTPGEKIIAYDLNQCYPYSMRNFKHPISEPSTSVSNEITKNTYFVTVYGQNYNAFPVRMKDGLHFDVEHGQFTVSIHEYNAAVETGLFECEDIIETVDFEKAATFDTFVDKFHGLRKEAQLSGDKVGALFYKYVCNSAYGKFAQSPDNYFNYLISDQSTNLNPTNDPDGYIPCTIVGLQGYILWKQHSMNTSRYNVATGASITGAARSMLIHALAKAKRPLYCDTDSIVCEGLKDVEIDKTKLGAWKIENTGDSFAIAGRKMYALFSKGECVKMASKGVHLTAQEIVRVAKGNIVTWKKDAPTFNFKTHTASYISRHVKMTA
jgi:hypothetical protein